MIPASSRSDAHTQAGLKSFRVFRGSERFECGSETKEEVMVEHQLAVCPPEHEE